jgi:hypothetical protein
MQEFYHGRYISFRGTGNGMDDLRYGSVTRSDKPTFTSSSEPSKVLIAFHPLKIGLDHFGD